MAKRCRGIKRSLWAGALIGALAALFVALAGHYLLYRGSGNGIISSGATQGLDLWTYYSMAQAVWRSPNGITYHYPYELYWPTPPVLFQLPITVLAWIGKITGLPLAFEIGRVAGGAGAGAAIAALGYLYPAGFWRRWFYVAVVLGGASFTLGAIWLAIDVAGWPGLTELHHYQPAAQGPLFWWLPFLATNLRMPLEGLYHAMVIGALACLALRRYGWAWALGLAVWMSNPFSAVALHAAVMPWLLWRILETGGVERTRWARRFAAWFGVNLAAALYYGWYLNRWPLLRDLHAQYRSLYLPPVDWWRLLMLVMPYGLGILLSVGNRRLRAIIWGTSHWRLFAILAIVHVLLLQQGFFLGKHAMQAYHYNRGYLHLGLVVVAWKVIIVLAHRLGCLRESASHRGWRPWKMAGARCRRFACVVCAVVVFTCGDQVLFGLYALAQPKGAGLVVESYDRIVRQIPPEPAPALVLGTRSIGATMGPSYVTAYTPHIAWDAPETMVVPFAAKRSQLLSEAMAGDHGGVAGLGIHYAIVTESNEDWLTALEDQQWHVIGREGMFLLLRAPHRP